MQMNANMKLRMRCAKREWFELCLWKLLILMDCIFSEPGAVATGADPFVANELRNNVAGLKAGYYRQCVKTQESHPREWVDGSDPTYQSSADPLGIPPTGVGGLFKSSLFPLTSDHYRRDLNNP